MKYLLAMYTEAAASKALTDDEFAEIMRKHEALRTELFESGELLNGAGLAYPEETRTVKLDGERPVSTQVPVVVGELNMSAYYQGRMR